MRFSLLTLSPVATSDCRRPSFSGNLSTATALQQYWVLFSNWSSLELVYLKNVNPRILVVESRLGTVFEQGFRSGCRRMISCVALAAIMV